MKPYLSVLKLRLINGLQYRAAAMAGVATQFFWGFITIMVFEAFYSHATAQPPMTLKELIAYVWLQQSFLALIVLWFRDNELFDLIVKGNMAYELCRPCDIYGFWYAKLIAQRVSSALLRCIPILVIVFVLPEPYRMMIPPNFISFLSFLAALLLGLLILVSISMFLYISVFVTMSPTGSLLLFSVVGEFFAGLVIPIPFMPGWVQVIANFLPFRWTTDFPFRVYSGQIPSSEALMGLMVQLVWLIVLFVVGRWVLNRVLRKIVVQGG
ncbi:ABC transporter permease [Camelliibacillus cellulosilyticus]|uniref:ABC transporter permease n=1 Tax=Camelliibacillus cellulosilyticus TaxID=2174486 RepID=A0ABV9GLK9_9BACL